VERQPTKCCGTREHPKPGFGEDVLRKILPAKYDVSGDDIVARSPYPPNS
jgi:hypothetical protein